MRMRKILYEEKNRLVSVYVVTIMYMLGDADGYPKQVIKLPEEMFNDKEFEKEFYDFVKVTNDCIKFDKTGRHGIDNEEDLVERYSQVPGWFERIDHRYFDDDTQELINELYPEILPKKTLMYDIPMDPYSDFYSKYYSLDIDYYDENGIRYKIKIEK